MISRYAFDVAPGFRIRDGFDKDVHILDTAKPSEPGLQHFGSCVVGDQNVNTVTLVFSVEVVQVSDAQLNIDIRLE